MKDYHKRIATRFLTQVSVVLSRAFEKPLGFFSVMWPLLSSTVMLYLSLSLCTVMEI